MDETIGAKGSRNDRRRSLIITKEQEKKLKKYKKEQDKYLFEQEEKKLKILQVKTAAIAVPLVVTGAIFKELLTPKKKEEYIVDKKKSLEKGGTGELQHAPSVSVKITTERFEQNYNFGQTEIEKKLPIEEKVDVVQVVEQNNILMPTTMIDNGLDRLKNREIVDYYIDKMQELRIDLKQVIYEYNLIEKDNRDVYESKIAQELLDKLNVITKKIEKLKKLLDLENVVDYDRNYINILIEDYLKDFENSKIVDEIKDSDLYILISSKIQELTEKSKRLNEELTSKKEEIGLDEEYFKELQEHYDLLDKFNNSLLRFQADQDVLIRDLEKKIANAITEEERIRIRFRYLQNQSHVILDLLAPQLLIPSANSGMKMAFAVASLIHIARNQIRPRKEVSRYRIINVTDYAKTITNSIDAIEKSLNLLNKSKKQLDDMLKDFRENYKQYIGQVKECDQLLDNLETILSELIEKEEELKRLKREQEKNLDKNNEKVKLIKKHEDA